MKLLRLLKLLGLLVRVYSAISTNIFFENNLFFVWLIRFFCYSCARSYILQLLKPLFRIKIN